MVRVRVRRAITQPLFDISKAPERIRTDLSVGNTYELRKINENPYPCADGTPGKPLWVVDTPDGRIVGAVEAIWNKIQQSGEIEYVSDDNEQGAAQ